MKLSTQLHAVLKKYIKVIFYKILSRFALKHRFFKLHKSQMNAHYNDICIWIYYILKINLLPSQRHHAVQNTSAEYKTTAQPRGDTEETHEERGQRQPIKI